MSLRRQFSQNEGPQLCKDKTTTINSTFWWFNLLSAQLGHSSIPQLNKCQGSRKQQHKIWKITKSQRVDAPQPHTLPNPNPSNPCRCYYCLRGLGQNPMAWLEPLPATPVTGRTQGLLDLAFCWALHRASSPEPADHHVPSFRTCCFRQ